MKCLERCAYLSSNRTKDIDSISAGKFAPFACSDPIRPQRTEQGLLTTRRTLSLRVDRWQR